MDAFRQETPRAADSIGSVPPSARLAPVDPVQSGPDGGGQIGGSVYDYDNLVTALQHYDEAPAGFGGTERQWLAVCARLCGWTGGEDLIVWSRRRVATYRQMMAAAVRDMLVAISVNNSLTRRIGE
jgi:hypothetical protein